MEQEQIVNLSKEHSFFTWSVQSQVKPLTAVRGEGVYFWDAKGKRYLDFSSQLMNVNAGHGNQKIIGAIQEQAATMAYAYPGIATEPRARLGQLLSEIAPGDMTKTLFTTGGGEANENAIKFSRLYTGRHKLLSRYRSFHGASAGCVGLVPGVAASGGCTGSFIAGMPNTVFPPPLAPGAAGLAAGAGLAMGGALGLAMAGPVAGLAGSGLAGRSGLGGLGLAASSEGSATAFFSSVDDAGSFPPFCGNSTRDWAPGVPPGATASPVVSRDVSPIPGTPKTVLAI